MELQKFVNKEFGFIRGLEVDEIPYLVGKDVAVALGYRNINRDIIRHVDEDDRIFLDKTQYQNGIEFDYKQIGQRGGWIINESGFYALVFGSELESARRFKRWVTSEVLPQIRKTGGYIPVTEADDEKTILAKAVGIYQRTVAEKDTIIAALKPKADEYDAFMNSHGNYSVNAVANIIGYGEYKFFAMLREMKILRYEQGDNVPYGRFRKSGHFIEVATTDPRGYNHTTTYVTPKGLSYLSKKFSQTSAKGTVA